jgi:hypothetical protein
MQADPFAALRDDNQNGKNKSCGHGEGNRTSEK